MDLLVADKEDIVFQESQLPSIAISHVAGVPFTHYSSGDTKILSKISEAFHEKLKVQRYLFMGDETMWRKGNVFLRHLRGHQGVSNVSKNSRPGSFTENIPNADGQLVGDEFTVSNQLFLLDLLKNYSEGALSGTFGTYMGSFLRTTFELHLVGNLD